MTSINNIFQIYILHFNYFIINVIDRTYVGMVVKHQLNSIPENWTMPTGICPIQNLNSYEIGCKITNDGGEPPTCQNGYQK